MIKYKYSKLYWFIKELKWIKAYFSPFKPPIPKFYFGKITIGVPWFLPRNWVNLTEKEIEEKSQKKYNELREELKIKVTLEHYRQQYKGSQKAIPKLIGFDFVELGWKTKWTDTDYRFEWSPLISFVFFKWQIAVVFLAPEPSHYWESWLYYEFNTDKSKSQKERIEQCQQEFKQNWISYKNGVEIKTNYYQFILKEKYYAPVRCFF